MPIGCGGTVPIIILFSENIENIEIFVIFVMNKNGNR